MGDGCGISGRASSVARDMHTARRLWRSGAGLGGYKGDLSPVIGVGMAMGGRAVLEMRPSIIGEAPPPKAQHDMT